MVVVVKYRHRAIVLLRKDEQELVTPQILTTQQNIEMITFQETCSLPGCTRYQA